MQKILVETIGKFLAPPVGTEALFTLVALAALVVAGMAIYAVMLTLKGLARRR